MAALGGAARRGSHVLGSSARASLSDLYGSSGRTGAAERETGRVSSRARGAAATATRPAALPGSSSRGVCWFYSRLLRRCTGLPRRVLENMWLGTSGLCLRFLSQRRSRCSPSGSARVFICAKSRPGGDVGRGEPVGARPRPAPTAGPGRGGARTAQPGDVAGARRERPAAPGGRAGIAGASLAASRGRSGSSWRLAALFLPISCF